MSRIGNKPVTVPVGVKVGVAERTVTVEGPLGRLEMTHRPEVAVSYDQESNLVKVTRVNDERAARAFHGLTRATLQNMMVGVTQGYERKLELQGVGYIAAIQYNRLQLRVGLANELQKPIPEGLTVTCPDQQ
ncbi:MAG: 50S ribosomal protein L6, partial [Thermoguttaceae bacterium]